ncbi:DUF6221 family protein [Streptomyces sp. NPDC051582]|uniref:DUF6221 family protein n=1 Tax=Streptomyces sp. NPDC051582 TaxID=3155167 RepID=UPI003438A5B6
MSAALLAFLHARLAEDEAHARAASCGPSGDDHWSLDEWFGREEPHSLIAAGNANHPTFLGHFTADPVPTAQAAHIARHDPARVLAEVEAKRQLLDDILRAGHEWNEEDHWYSCAAARDHEGEPVCIDESRAGGPCDCGRDEQVERRARLLALPYCGHADFRPEWAPKA